MSIIFYYPLLKLYPVQPLILEQAIKFAIYLLVLGLKITGQGLAECPTLENHFIN